jgi:hypothetical protein
MNRAIPLTASALAALCSAASAQQAADVIIHDADNDQVVVFTDVDGDGQYKTFGEQRRLAAGGPPPNGYEPYDTEVRIEGGRFVSYWLESNKPFMGTPPFDRHSLRPLVEPGRRGPGLRPRSPHRPEEGRHRLPPGRRRHDRREDPRAQAAQEGSRHERAERRRRRREDFEQG